jgi:hypothetical protein
MADRKLRIIVEGVEKGAKQTLTNLNNDLQGIAGGLLKIAAPAAIATGAIKGISFAVGEAADAELTMAKLEAVLKSTGEVAGVSREMVDDLSGSLSEMTMFTDDAITEVSTLMLTFKNVGREVFPEAIAAALDMSTVMEQDLKSSAIQLGKALNDPVEGISALTRIGVSFTEEQQEQIKAMVAAGDVMGAQKMILQELQSEFGGAAEAAGNTYAGEVTKAKNATADLAEEIGQSLIPELKRALPWYTKIVKGITSDLNASNELNEATRRGMFTTQEWLKIREDYAAGLIDNAGIIELVTEKQKELDSASQLAKGTMWDWAEMNGIVIDKSEVLTEVTRDLERELKTLQITIEGPLGDANEKFAEQQRRLRDQAEELRSKMAELAAQPVTDKQQRELAGLVEDYNEVQQAIKDNAAAHDEATKRIMFNLLQQRAAIDGLTEAELDALNDIALQWGLVDQATYNYVQAADQYFDILNDELVTSADNVGHIKLQAMQLLGVIDSLPTHKTIIFELITKGQVPTIPADRRPYEDVPFGAHGLDMIVPPGYLNDSYMIRAQSGERVTITPPDVNAGGGGGVYIHSLNIQATPGMNEQALADAVIERLHQRVDSAKRSGRSFSR